MGYDPIGLMVSVEAPYPAAMRPVVALALLFALSGCSEPQSLWDHQAWTQLGAASDPWPNRPEDADCSPLGWFPEPYDGRDSVTIETNACPWASLQQPSLADVEVGDSIDLEFWHFNLTAAEPAEAEFGVLLDGQLLYSWVSPIPAPAGLVETTISSPVAAPAGAPLVLHLHNHGDNSYNFVDLIRQ